MAWNGCAARDCSPSPPCGGGLGWGVSHGTTPPRYKLIGPWRSRAVSQTYRSARGVGQQMALRAPPHLDRDGKSEAM
jgi:hypothetical protein